jgi:hypothetical protein
MRTRYRKKLIQQRTSEGQRLAKVLEDGGIKIDSVASTLLGVSGRDMIEALIAGERDPHVLADLARGRLRAKLEDLVMACDGRFTADHGLHLDAHDHLTVPHSARMYDWWLGGKDNFASDRAMGEAFMQVIPGINVMARENRRFLARAVRHLAGDAGIRQFLDVGTGIPT